MREVREPKPSKVDPWWLLAQHSVVLHCGFSALAAAMRSLLLPNCEGSHSVRVYRATNRHAVILYSHWSIYIDRWLHRYSSLQMRFAFKTQNQIRQVLPLWRRFDLKYLFRGNYLYHTMCVSTISLNSFDGMLSFSNRKKLSRKKL